MLNLIHFAPFKTSTKMRLISYFSNFKNILFNLKLDKTTESYFGSLTRLRALSMLMG
jgi:hypothetical protein